MLPPCTGARPSRSGSSAIGAARPVISPARRGGAKVVVGHVGAQGERATQGEQSTGGGHCGGQPIPGPGRDAGHGGGAEHQGVDTHGAHDRGGPGHPDYVTSLARVRVPKVSEQSIPRPAEQWRPIIGYEGIYEVSDAGRVRSLPRIVGGRLPGSKRQWAGRVMRLDANPRGRLAVQLSCEGVLRKRMVHELVLEAFTGLPAPPGRDGRHRNDDPSDNRIENLEWGTRLREPRGARAGAVWP